MIDYKNKSVINFPLFKPIIYTLLTINFLYYTSDAGTLSQAMDTTGWMILLMSDELRIQFITKHKTGNIKFFSAYALQIIGYSMASWAVWAYFQESSWGEFTNGVLWLALDGLLTIDLFWTKQYNRVGWIARNAAYMILYSGLIAVCINFLLAGDLMEFYDASLWIICYIGFNMTIKDYIKPKI